MTRAIGLLVAEGMLDVVAAQRMAASLSIKVAGQSISLGGKDNFLRNLPRYNQAAKHFDGIVLAICDHDSNKCVGPELPKLLQSPRSSNLVFRLCVPELEAWLLADHHAMSDLLGLSLTAFPREPDQLVKPKRSLVDLARKGRADVALQLCPPRNQSGLVGPEYSMVMEQFVRERWDPRRAAVRSPSLSRAMKALRSAVGKP